MPSFFGVLFVSLCWGLGGPLSFSAVQTLSPAAATFGRCVFAFLGLSPFFILDGPRLFRRLSPRGLMLLTLSGFLLGVHFYFFIAGVAYASLATTVMIVAVEPVLILAIGVLGFKEKLTPHGVLGILFCISGVMIISALPNWLSGSSNRGWGDLCAVLAVVTYAIYYAINRGLRSEEARMNLPGGVLRGGFAMASWIYLFASLSSGSLIFITTDGQKGLSGPLDAKVWGALIAMGLIPTLLGHSLSQILSRRVHPIWISLMSPGETLMSLLIGWVFLNQSLRPVDQLGGLLIGAGVIIALLGEIRKKDSSRPK